MATPKLPETKAAEKPTDEVKIFELKKANATDLAEQLKKLAPGATIVADGRTNFILVRSSKEDAEMLEAIALKLDEQESRQPSNPAAISGTPSIFRRAASGGGGSGAAASGITGVAKAPETVPENQNPRSPIRESFRSNTPTWPIWVTCCAKHSIKYLPSQVPALFGIKEARREAIYM